MEVKKGRVIKGYSLQTLINIEEEFKQIESMAEEELTSYFAHAFNIAKKQDASRCNFDAETLKQLNGDTKAIKEKMKVVVDYYDKYLERLRKSSTSYEIIDGKEYLKNTARHQIDLIKAVLYDMKNFVQLIEKCEARQHRDMLRKKEEVETKISPKQYSMVHTFFKGEKIEIKSVDTFIGFVSYIAKHHSFGEYRHLLDNINIASLSKEEQEGCYHVLKRILLREDKKRRRHKHERNYPLLGYLDKIDHLISELQEYEDDPSIKEEQRHCFDIIWSLLKKESNLEYLQKAVTRGKGFANARTENMSLLAYLSNAFQTNVLIKLKNQEPDYTNPEFLKEVYLALRHSPLLELSQAEIEEVEASLRDFEKQILKSKYKAERKEEIVKLIEAMLASKKEEVKAKVELSYSLPFIEYTYQNAIHDDSRKSFVTDYTIALKDPDTPYLNYAYSITEEENDYRRYWLNIHVTDISMYFEQGIFKDEEVRQRMFSNIKESEALFPDDLLKKYLSMEEDKIRPTITYRFLINNKGQVEGFMVVRSITRINRVLPYEALDDRSLRHQDLMKPFIIVDRFLSEEKENRGVVMDHSFSGVANEVIGHYFNQNKLPYIYRVCESASYDETIEAVGKLNYLFHRLNDEDYRAIIGAICEEKPRASYSKRNFGHADLERRYHSDLLSPLDSYVGIILQGITKIALCGRKEELPTAEVVEEIIEQANTLKTKKNTIY